MQVNGHKRYEKDKFLSHLFPTSGSSCLEYLYCNEADSADMGSPIVAKVRGQMTVVGLRQSCQTSEESYLKIDQATAQKINPHNGTKEKKNRKERATVVQIQAPWPNEIQVKIKLDVRKYDFILYIIDCKLQCSTFYKDKRLFRRSEQAWFGACSSSCLATKIRR